MRLLKRHHLGFCHDYGPLIACQALSFTNDIEDGIKVIGIHTHRTKIHKIKKASMNHKSVNQTLLRKNEGVKDIRLLLETLIWCDINLYIHLLILP